MTIDSASATGTVATSILFYLYADRIIAPANALNGVKLPGKDGHVNLRELGTTLFAVAFWSLREEGLIRLDIVKRKVLFIFPSTRITITPIQPGERPDLPGLEGELLALVGGKVDPHVYATVRDWYKHDVYNPYNVVVNYVAKLAARAGYLNEVDAHRNAVAGLIKGKTMLEPNDAAIATLEGLFATDSARWEQFKVQEADLCQALLKACKGAIATRAKQNDPPNT